MTLAILDARDKEYVVVAVGTDLIATYVQQAIAAGQTAQDVLDAILAEGLSEGVFPSEAAGLSGTTDGQYFWVGSGGTVTLYLNDTGAGDEIAELATAAGLALKANTADLAAPTGGEMVGFIQSGTGAVARTAQDKKRDALHAKDFGAVGDGVADDTDALKNLLAAMQATGKPGSLGGSGEDTRYLVSPGELEWTFDNTPTVASPGPAGPTLYTSGKVTLVSDGTVDAPLLSIHNDPVAGGRFVCGGHIDPLSFEDTSVGGAATRRHALLLYGINSMTFGVMTAANGIRGDVIHLELHGNDTTADGWHIGDCVFDGVILWNGGANYAFNAAANTQVFTYSTIRHIWAINCGGAFKGAGSGLLIGGISAQYCSATAFDFVPTAGSVQGLRVGFMELDACFKSIRLAGVQHADFPMVRHVHRKDVNTGNIVWPTKAVQFHTDGNNQVSNVKMLNHHRFAEVPSDADLPAQIIDWGNSANISSVQMDHFYSNAGGFGTLTLSRFIGNYSVNSLSCSSKVQGASVLKHISLSQVAVVARVTTAAGQVSAGTYDGSTPITFASEQFDPAGAFSGTTFTAPAKGLYSLRCRLLYQPGADSLCRLGFFLNAGAVPIRELRQVTPDGPSSGQDYPLELGCIYPLERGDTIKVCLTEAFARDLLGGTAGLGDNNYFEAFLL